MAFLKNTFIDWQSVFFRVDKSRSKAIEGTGLGLTIVKHILNKHRGNIEISSTLNKGSIFTIQLPEAPIS